MKKFFVGIFSLITVFSLVPMSAYADDEINVKDIPYISEEGGLETVTPEQYEEYVKDGSWDERVEFYESLNHSLSPDLIANLQLGSNENKVELGKVKGVTASMPSVGDVKTLVITCDFEDYRYDDTIGAKTNKWMNGKEDKTSYYYPYESLAAYYKRSSFGKLNLSSEIYEYHSSHERSYYDSVEVDIVQELLDSYIRDVKNQCDGTEEEKEQYLNSYLAQFDYDSDGVLDGIYLLMSGPTTDSGTFWWSHVGYYNGYQVGDYTTGSMCILMEEQMSDNVKASIHETGHMLGLPDYYDKYYRTPSYHVGTFDMMHNNSSDHNGLTKLLLGWINPDEVQIIKDKSINQIELQPYASTGDVLIIVPDWDDELGLYNEFYMVEYFKSEENDTLKEIEDKNGLRIYHVYAKLNEDKTRFIAETDEYYKGRIPLIQGMDKDQMKHQVTDYSSSIAVGNLNNFPENYDCFYFEGDEFTPYTAPSSYLYCDNEDRYQTGHYSGLFVDNIIINVDKASFRIGYENEMGNKSIVYEVVENTAGTYSSNHQVRLRFDQEVWLSSNKANDSCAYIVNEGGEKVCDLKVTLASADVGVLFSVYSDIFISDLNQEEIGSENYTIIIPQGSIKTATHVVNDEIRIPFDNRKVVTKSDSINIEKKYWKNEWGGCIDENGNGGIVTVDSTETEGVFDVQYYIVDNMKIGEPIKLQINGVSQNNIKGGGVQQLVSKDDEYYLLALYFDEIEDWYSSGKYMDLVIFEKKTGKVISERELTVNSKYKSGIMDNMYVVMHGFQIDFYDFEKATIEYSIQTECGLDESADLNRHYMFRRLNDDYIVVLEPNGTWVLFNEKGNLVEIGENDRFRGIDYINDKYYILSPVYQYGINSQSTYAPCVLVYNDLFELIDEYQINVEIEGNLGPNRIVKMDDGYILYSELSVGTEIDNPYMIYVDNDFNVKYVVEQVESRILSTGKSVVYNLGRGKTYADIIGSVFDYSNVQDVPNDNAIIMPEDFVVDDSYIMLQRHIKREDFKRYFASSGCSVTVQSENEYLDNDDYIIITCNDEHHKKYYTIKLTEDFQHELVEDEAVAATYKKTGLTAGRHCSVCGKVLKEQEVIPQLVAVTEIRLSQIDAKIEVGDTIELSATVIPENAANLDVNWQSSDATVAAVDANGVVTAKKAGSTTITCTAADGSGVSASCVVTVTNPTEADIPAITDTTPEEVEVGSTVTKDELVANIDNSISAEQQAKLDDAVEKGQTLTYRLDIEDSGNVAEQQTVKTYGDQNDYKVSEYFDISIGIYGDDENTPLVEISETAEEIPLMIAIPEELKKEGRGFFVLRFHDGAVTVLPATQNADGTLSFSSKLFSTYALAYRDTAVPTYSITVNHGTADIESASAGTTITLTAAGYPNTTFKGWESSSEGVTFANVSSKTTTFVMPTHDVTIQAKFEVQVTFSANGHGTAPAVQKFAYGSTASKPDDLKAEGYVFGGWYKNAACTEAYDFGTKVKENTTLYAKWTVCTHTYGAWKVTKEATTSSTGMKSHTCSVCGKIETEEISKLTVAVSGIILNQTNANVEAGKTLGLTATIAPNNATNKGVTWKSSNTSVATVSNTGIVAARARGTATITCTAADGSGKSASCIVKVTDYTPTEAFAARLYEKCLGREPEEAGLKHWNSVLVNKERTGAQVAYGFVFSKEYQQKNTSDEDYVEMLYNVFMDRGSDAGGKAHWLEMLGNGVSREYVFRGFAMSQEYTNICNKYDIERGSVTLTQARDKNPKLTAYVNRMYTKALDRAGEEDGLNHWCNVIQSGTKTPEQVAESFILSKEFKNKKLSDEEYVKVLYRTFMGREYDASGLEHWKNELKRGCTREEILHRFATSQEFKNIQASFGL